MTDAAADHRHLHSVDVVRSVTILGVIGVHATSLLTARSSTAAGMVLTLLHVTRQVFLLLSAFVLVYSCRGSLLTSSTFWRRRYPLVLAPYAVWTAIYVLADGPISSGAAITRHFAVSLVDAGARYHLYFLLVVFQLYAVFPWLMRGLQRLSSHHGEVLVISAAAQLAFTTAAHYRLPAPGIVGMWLRHPGLPLLSYQFYVVAGAIAALHFEELTIFVRRRPQVVVTGAAAVVVLAVASYALDTRVLQMAPIAASDVFQPVVVLESVGFTMLLYALGVWVSVRATPRLRRLLEAQSDISFGVFLAHPLLLQAITATAGIIGMEQVFPTSPSLPALALRLAVIVPLVYLGTGIAVHLVRPTPVSLALTGRSRCPPRPRRSTQDSSPRCYGARDHGIRDYDRRDRSLDAALHRV
jgi:peptidoglycan/LPS O-acetylase OafA/YrhL